MGLGLQGAQLIDAMFVLLADARTTEHFAKIVYRVNTLSNRRMSVCFAVQGRFPKQEQLSVQFAKMGDMPITPSTDAFPVLPGRIPKVRCLWKNAMSVQKDLGQGVVNQSAIPVLQGEESLITFTAWTVQLGNIPRWVLTSV